MFEDTRPPELDAAGGTALWGDFRISHLQERLALLRQLRDSAVPVILSSPGGHSMGASLWSLDGAMDRMSFSVDVQHPHLTALVEAEEAVAVAYLDSVKLQFEVEDLCLVHGRDTVALQCQLPRELYRFQRREAYRVRPQERHAPTARFRHPSMPEMRLALRVLDVSIGGCALWQPDDVPGLQAGTRLAEVDVELDGTTRFAAAVMLQHVTAMGLNGRGVRLGCAWHPLSADSARTLQRWIDQTQKRARLLSLG
jgi:flagellar brake protein